MSTVTRRRTSARTPPEQRERDTAPHPSQTAPRAPRRQAELRRRRAALVAVLIAVVAAVAVALAVVLSAAGTVPPATGAAGVVPADVLAYVHLSTDSGRPAVRQAQALGRRFPDYPLAYAAAINRLSAIVAGGSSSVDFATVIRPWLGREVAFAVLDTQGGSARR